MSRPEPPSASILSVLPQLLWFILAVFALVIFAKPALKLLDQAQLQKLGIGFFNVEFAQVAVARVKSGAGVPKTPAEFKPIADRARAIQSKLSGAYVLWVDDNNPSQNVQERRGLESFNIKFDLASSTDEALKWLDRAHYDAIISDISRPSESTDQLPCFTAGLPTGAGCAMAKMMHERYGDKMPPMIFYSASYPDTSGVPPFAFGVTNRVDKLFFLVFDALERRVVDQED